MGSELLNAIRVRLLERKKDRNGMLAAEIKKIKRERERMCEYT